MLKNKCSTFDASLKLLFDPVGGIFVLSCLFVAISEVESDGALLCLAFLLSALTIIAKHLYLSQLGATALYLIE